jgi:large subunit ribosomal protein L10
MLTRSVKDVLIKELNADILKAQGVFLTNVIGLTSNDGVALRKQVRDAKGKLVVTRNTLFQLAAVGTPAEAMLKGLKGPSAIAIAFEDAAAVAKAINDAEKDHEGIVELKAGILDGKLLEIAELKQLANLPSRDEMLGTLLATFMAPVSAFARVLHAINEQKGEGAAPVEAAPEAEATPETTEE